MGWAERWAPLSSKQPFRMTQNLPAITEKMDTDSMPCSYLTLGQRDSVGGDVLVSSSCHAQLATQRGTIGFVHIRPEE